MVREMNSRPAPAMGEGGWHELGQLGKRGAGEGSAHLSEREGARRRPSLGSNDELRAGWQALTGRLPQDALMET